MSSHLSSLTKLTQNLTTSTASAVHGFHGTGEVIRGNVNSTIDGLIPNHESKEGGGRARNDAIARKRLGEVKGAEGWFRDGVKKTEPHAGGGSAAGAVGNGVSSGQGNTGVAGTDDNKQGAWQSPSAMDSVRQEREKEKLWEAERREREADFQQQTVPCSFPCDATPNDVQYSNSQEPQNFPPLPPPPALNHATATLQSSAPTYSQAQGFQHGTRSRLRSQGHGRYEEHGLSSLLHHHKSSAGGSQGRWLSQGGVRIVAGASDGRQQVPPQDPRHNNTGAGAARLAWSGGQR